MVDAWVARCTCLLRGAGWGGGGIIAEYWVGGQVHTCTTMQQVKECMCNEF